MKTLTTLVLVLAASLPGAPAGDITLAVAGRANSTPWIASSGSFVAVAWAAATEGRFGDVMLATSRDGGATFGPPVRVNATPGEARINGEIAPRVTLSGRTGSTPVIAVTWNARDGAMQIKTARSTDGGRTFSAPLALQAGGAAGERGWPASAVDARGTLHTIWLDHRGLAGPMNEGQGDHDGVAMAQGSSLYYAPAGGAERELFKGVCYCCKTAMAIGTKGEIYAAWRHVFAGNMRDMGFSASRDGGRTFSPLVRINEDGWSIRGCPDDGPAMAVDATGTIHLVWPTVQSEQGVILYATSKDGRSFSTPTRMPTLGGPKPSHPQIAIGASGRIFVAWDESRNGVRRAAIATVDASKPAEILGDVTSYAVMAPAGNGMAVAWTSGPPDRSTISVRVIP